MNLEEFKKFRELPIEEGILKLGEYYEPKFKYDLTSEEIADQLQPVFGSVLKEKKAKTGLESLRIFMLRFIE